MKRKNNKGRLAFFMIFSILLLSCEEKEVGCLDLNATNFDVSADESGNCTYPNLSFEISHIFLEDSIRFLEGNVYDSGTHPWLSVLSIRFFLSDLSLVSAENGQLSIDELLEFQSKLPQGEQLVQKSDDLLLIEPDRILYDVGTYPLPGIYEGIIIQPGIDELWEYCALDERIPDNHVIRTGGMINEMTGRKYDLVLSVIPDTSIVTDTVFITAHLDNPAKLIPLDFEIARGGDIVLKWEMDYYTLFFGIHFFEDDEALIRSKLETNLYNAIRLAD